MCAGVCVCAFVCVGKEIQHKSVGLCVNYIILISCTEQQVQTGLCCIHKRVPSAVPIRSLFPRHSLL